MATQTADSICVREDELDRLLALIEDTIDPDHCEQVDERYRRALACEAVDRPPLVVRLPFSASMTLSEPFESFGVYPYHVAFRDPVAMMHNELLTSVVPGLMLKDDSPLLIRNNHGIIQVASLLGGHWEQHDDNPPWVKPFGTGPEVEAIAGNGWDFDLEAGGILERSFATLRLYHQKLADYPNARRAIQIAMPDLQGPLDTADMLWGSDIFIAFYEQPDLVSRFLSRIVDATLAVESKFRAFTTDRLGPVATAQHAWELPGRLLIRDDSAIMISAEMYAEHVRPHDGRLLEAVGGGTLHFCGDGRHLIDAMLETPGMMGFDLGQPWMMDVPEIYAKTMAASVPFANHQPGREDLVSGKARAEYPTGIVLVYESRDMVDAEIVVQGYQKA